MVNWGKWWDGLGWASHIDTAVRYFGFGMTSTAEEQESGGWAGRFGWRDEREMLRLLNRLTPLERRRVEQFHAWYFKDYGSTLLGNTRAKERFSQYRTVLAGLKGSVTDLGIRKTRGKFHKPVQGAGANAQVPFDIVETEFEEKLYKFTEDEAIGFLKHLASTLGKAEREIRAANSSEPTVRKHICDAGHLVLCGAGLPRMPEPGEKDWFDLLGSAVEYAPALFNAGSESAQGVYVAMQKDTAEKKATLSRIERFFHKILPF